MREVKESYVVKFVKHTSFTSLVCHDGLFMIMCPSSSAGFQRFCNKFRIQSVSSMAYYPAANGLVEAFNKTIEKLLKKFVPKS